MVSIVLISGVRNAKETRSKQQNEYRSEYNTYSTENYALTREPRRVIATTFVNKPIQSLILLRTFMLARSNLETQDGPDGLRKDKFPSSMSLAVLFGDWISRTGSDVRYE